MPSAQTIDNQILNYLQLLTQKKKKAILSVVKTFAENETDLWEEMPDEIRASVKKGMDEVTQGKGTPHKEVMKKYRKWLKK